jgi:hypothetical protein
MSLALTAIAIAVSMFTVAYQVRSGQKQAQDSLRAEQIAGAFFDLYGGWALNRRAQIEPVSHDMLRTSSAQYYTAAFRLSALVEDDTLDQLKKFMESGLGGRSQSDESFDSLWALHRTVSECLGYRNTMLSRDKFKDMFWGHGRNVPGTLLGAIEPADFDSEVARAHAASGIALNK